jgi:hypothetical protein
MGKKKRKKVRSHAIWDGSWTRLIVLVFLKEHVSKVSTPLPDRGGSYGVGMFGIGAR